MGKQQQLWVMEEVEKHIKRLRLEIESDDELDKLSRTKAEAVRDLRGQLKLALSTAVDQTNRADAMARDNYAMRALVDDTLGVDADIRHQLGAQLGIDAAGAIGAVRLICMLWNMDDEKAVKECTRAALEVGRRSKK